MTILILDFSSNILSRHALLKCCLIFVKLGNYCSFIIKFLKPNLHTYDTFCRAVTEYCKYLQTD